MNKRLSIFIVGRGNAAQRHRSILEDHPYYDVVGHEDAAEVVDICSAPYQHLDDILYHLERGRHVICEKPMAGSLANMDKIRAASYQHKRRVFPIAQFEFVKKDIPDDPICRWPRDRAYYERSPWRASYTGAFGGVLANQGYHIIHHYATNEDISTVNCTIEYTFDAVQVETRATCWFSTGHGNPPTVTMEIGSDETAVLGDSIIGFHDQFTDIREAIDYGRAPAVRWKDARDAIELLTACYYSASRGGLPVGRYVDRNHPFYQGWSEHFARRSRQSESSLRTHEQPPEQPDLREWASYPYPPDLVTPHVQQTSNRRVVRVQAPGREIDLPPASAASGSA